WERGSRSRAFPRSAWERGLRNDTTMSIMTTTPAPTAPSPPPEDLKLARRLSRRRGLFAPDLLKSALKRAFVMLRPDLMWKNPVMFTVEVGTVLSIFYTVYLAFNPGASLATLGYLIQID